MHSTAPVLLKVTEGHGLYLSKLSGKILKKKSKNNDETNLKLPLSASGRICVVLLDKIQPFFSPDKFMLDLFSV